MANQFKISEKVMENILSNAISIKSKEPQNYEHMFKILMDNLNDTAKESIVHLSLIEEVYNPVTLNGYVKLIPPSYHKSDKYEEDILQDMGLYAGHGMVYAKVIGDTSWGSEPFNPFYNSIKIEFIYHNKEKQLEMYEHSCSPLELIAVSVDDIKYFDILATDSEPIHQADLFMNVEQIEDNTIKE